MYKFPQSPTKTWRKGAGVPSQHLMRRLVAGESLLLFKRGSRNASAAISMFRKAYPKAHGHWTTRAVADGVEILRLPDDYDGSRIDRRAELDEADLDIFG